MNTKIKMNWKSTGMAIAVTGALVTAFALSVNADGPDGMGYGGMMGVYGHPMMGSYNGPMMGVYGHPMMGGGYSLDRLSKALNLSGEQLDKIQGILDRENASRDELRRKDFESRNGRRDGMDAIRSSTREEIAQVLTGEQRTRLKAIDTYSNSLAVMESNRNNCFGNGYRD